MRKKRKASKDSKPVLSQKPLEGRVIKVKTQPCSFCEGTKKVMGVKCRMCNGSGRERVPQY